MSGQRPGRKSLDSGHPGALFFAHEDRFPRSTPWDERKYIVLTNRGDEYLERIEVGKWDACKLHFHWTKDRKKALEWTGAEVRSKFIHVVQAFSAPQLERIF
jgi:hypothetical protein